MYASDGSYKYTMNNYEIINIFKYNYDKVLLKVIKRALKLEKVKKSSFSIILTNDEDIKHLNNKYRNIDKVTDVLSFTLNEYDPITKKILLGDIYISVPKLKEQALEYGHSETRELCFLSVHGILHLLGYDHMTLEDEKIMMEKTEMILNEFKNTKKD